MRKKNKYYFYWFQVKRKATPVVYWSGMLVLSAADGGFEPRSVHTEDNKMGMCCLSAKHAAVIKE